MLNFLKEYFIFSRGERNGIIVLLIIIVILIFLPYFLSFLRERIEIDFSQFQKEIQEFKKQQALAQEKNNNQNSRSFELFDFDPNEITKADWKKLGVNEKIARIIMNYRKKGGVFWDKDDLLKIYGFDTAKYEILVPYIVITEDDEQSKEKYAMNPLDKPVYKKLYKQKQKPKKYPRYEKKTEYKPKEKIVVELNAADSLMLVGVNGIGPVLSIRIIKYRNMLGGFVNVDQIMEVYGMDSTWFQIMKPSLRVDGNQVSKIQINNITQWDLQKHPYFRKNVAKAILNYRQQHGAFTSIGDLQKIYLVDENLFQKIKPYIVIEVVEVVGG